LFKQLKCQGLSLSQLHISFNALIVGYLNWYMPSLFGEDTFNRIHELKDFKNRQSHSVYVRLPLAV